MRRKSKVVEKSENPWYQHGLGLLNTKELQPQVKSSFFLHCATAVTLKVRRA